MPANDPTNRTTPYQFWHCCLKISGQSQYAVVNDASYPEIDRSIVVPWNSGRSFSVEGTIVRTADAVAEIRIVQTDKPFRYYAERHNEAMRSKGVADLATDRRMLVFAAGTDMTFDLLFSGTQTVQNEPSYGIIERVCRRLPQVARVLTMRSRKGKSSYEIADEYDVQDLLHATLRAYLKYAVQEDPLPRVGGAKSSRADISVEELGVLIEVKYVRGPDDQRRIFEEYSQDLVLYASWAHLAKLIYLIYNSADLRDPEALEKLSGTQEVNGRRFDVQIVLA